MRIGDEVIKAKIQTREEAERQYSEALTQGKTAFSTIVEYPDCNRIRPITMAVRLLYHIYGPFGTLMMVGLGVTSLILALVASTASTRRRGWVVAPIICAPLAVGLYVLRILIALISPYLPFL